MGSPVMRPTLNAAVLAVGPPVAAPMVGGALMTADRITVENASKMEDDRLALIDRKGGGFVEQPNLNQPNAVVHVLDSVPMPK